MDYRIVNHGIQVAKTFTSRGPEKGFNSSIVGLGYSIEDAYQDAKEGALQLVELALPDFNPWGVSDLEVSPDDYQKFIFCFVEIQFNS